MNSSCEELMNMITDDLLKIYNECKIDIPENVSKDNLIAQLSQCECTHTIGIWHDHYTILGHGYKVVTVKEFYDNAV